DGVELERRAASLAHALLHAFGERAQVHVAGRDLRPRVGDADERAAEILVREADGAEHRTRRRAIAPIENDRAMTAWAGRGCAPLALPHTPRPPRLRVSPLRVFSADPLRPHHVIPPPATMSCGRAAPPPRIR